jgi:hypothetical protein
LLGGWVGGWLGGWWVGGWVGGDRGRVQRLCALCCRLGWCNLARRPRRPSAKPETPLAPSPPRRATPGPAAPRPCPKAKKGLFAPAARRAGAHVIRVLLPPELDKPVALVGVGHAVLGEVHVDWGGGGGGGDEGAQNGEVRGRNGLWARPTWGLAQTPAGRCGGCCAAEGHVGTSRRRAAPSPTTCRQQPARRARRRRSLALTDGPDLGEQLPHKLLRDLPVRARAQAVRGLARAGGGAQAAARVRRATAARRGNGSASPPPTCGSRLPT